jgi:hypothetical protein
MTVLTGGVAAEVEAESDEASLHVANGIAGITGTERERVGHQREETRIEG